MSFCKQGGRRVARASIGLNAAAGWRCDERIVKRFMFRVDPVCAGALGQQSAPV